MIKILSVIIILFLSACSGVKDAFTLKKKSSTDEFLVEKKSPLVMPPDYGNLPEPFNDRPNQEIKTNDEGSVKDLLGTKENDLLKKDQNQSSSIEESILKKIN
jgi:hypothetical protein